MVSFSRNWVRRNKGGCNFFGKNVTTASFVLLLLILISLLWRREGPSGLAPPSEFRIGRRRSKAHFCFSSLHSQIGTRLLLTEFGYSGVNAADGDDWDLMYGGYPYCGTNTTHVLGKENPNRTIDNRKNKDWKMEHGLNKLMLEKGFDTLQPHQVYYPCMGCSASYCNKRDLCRILSDINPDWCYVLPDHVDRLKPKMDGTQPWVLKRDAFDIHLHTGRGVRIISDKLPSVSEQATMEYLVQPWNEPFLGEGPWRRKSEVRFTVAITSVYPLRAYVYGKPYVVYAAKRYTNSQEAMYDKCMTDTHSSTHACRVEDTEEDKNFVKLVHDHRSCNRCLDYSFYAEHTGLSSQFLEDSHALIAQVLKAGHTTLENNIINKGINKSGASCFSHMRVDMGITADMKPFMYEFPEFHNMRENFAINVRETRDLFKLVGLDGPALLRDERADYEFTHRGDFVLLGT